jgi:RNA polymerase sigma-70 factor (ECF subfamily)
LATLIRLLGDFDKAEEALHDAFAAAARTWPRDGVPANPFSWLVSTGRFRAIDHIRRRSRFDASFKDIEDSLYPSADEEEIGDMDLIEDDMLRLIFTCCHPAIPSDAQMAMALREVCGLTTEEIAHAFLVPAPTMAQRIVRAKSKIRAAGIPYEVPARQELPQRLDRVLHVIYLVFNEGYSASSGSEMIRTDLAVEAIRLARLLAALLPHPDVSGLLSLMLLQDSRRLARSGPNGELVLLADQNRTKWDRGMIAEGLKLLGEVMAQGEIGIYTLQAAIAAEHALAANRGLLRSSAIGPALADCRTQSSRRCCHAGWTGKGAGSGRRDSPIRRPRLVPPRPFRARRLPAAAWTQGGSCRGLRDGADTLPASAGTGVPEETDFRPCDDRRAVRLPFP